MANRHEIERLFGPGAAIYDEIVPFFRPIAQRLAELMAATQAATPTNTFVDVASGRTALGDAARAHLGAQKVVAGDISAAMLAAASPARAAGVHLVQWDAENLPLRDGSADAVGCSTSIRFFPSASAAIAEMFRVTRHSGRVGLSELGLSDARWWFFPDLLRRHGYRPPAGPRPEPLPSLLSAAGFVEITECSEELVFVFQDEHEWWRWVTSHSLGALVRDLGAQAESFRTAALAIVSELDPVELRQTVRFVAASKP